MEGVSLRSLRVSADMDASKYVAGANAKVAADQQMVAGARQVNVALTETNVKVSQAADPVARLGRQFVDGEGKAAQMARGIQTLNRALEQGKIEASRAEQIYAGMAQKLGMVANGADITAQGYTRLGSVVTNVNMQLHAQEGQANATATALGRVSAVNDNMARFRRQNLMFQAQDVGVSLAGGMNPLMVMMQQGSQIAGIYGGNGGVNALLRDATSLAGSFATRLGPVAIAAAAAGLAIREMQQDIERATGKAVTFRDTASAAFGVIVDDVRAIGDAFYTFVEPAIAEIAPWLEAAWARAVDAFKSYNNALIGGWRTAYDIFVNGWASLPDAMTALGERAANGLIAAIETGIKKILSALDAFHAQIEPYLQAAFPGMEIPSLSEAFSIGGIDIGGTSAEQRLRERWGGVWDRTGDNFSRDWTGDYFDSVRRRAQERLTPNGFPVLPDGTNAPIPIPRFRGVDDVPGVDLAALREAKRAYEAEFDAVNQRVLNVLDTFTDTLISSGGDVGKAFLAAFMAGMNDVLQQQIRALASDITSMILGRPAPGAAGTGAGGSVISFGSLIGALGGAANDNSTAGKIVRMPLDPITTGSTSSSSLLQYLAAGRPSSYISDMSSGLQSGLAAMIADAPGSITITSGARSIARQTELWNQALAKYGSAAAARRWVAPPGHSQHNFGNAADLAFGDPATRAWAHDNADRYGLKFPMAHEPWHIETAGARSGKAAANALDDLKTSADKAASGLGDLGDGMSQAGQKMAQAAAGGGGGGGFGGFGGLLSAVLGVGGMFRPAIFAGSGHGGAGAAMWGGSRISGFASGTESAPPGWAWVGEEGPELMRMRGGETIRSHGRSTQMAGQRPSLNVTHNVINNAGVDVRTEESQDEEGNITMTTFLDRAIAENLTRRGTASNSTARSMGLRPPRKRR